VHFQDSGLATVEFGPAKPSDEGSRRIQASSKDN
jgi:hypothetical protein